MVSVACSCQNRLYMLYTLLIVISQALDWNVFIQTMIPSSSYTNILRVTVTLFAYVGSLAWDRSLL